MNSILKKIKIKKKFSISLLILKVCKNIYYNKTKIINIYFIKKKRWNEFTTFFFKIELRTDYNRRSPQKLQKRAHLTGNSEPHSWQNFEFPALPGFDGPWLGGPLWGPLDRCWAAYPPAFLFGPFGDGWFPSLLLMRTNFQSSIFPVCHFAS